MSRGRAAHGPGAGLPSSAGKLEAPRERQLVPQRLVGKGGGLGSQRHLGMVILCPGLRLGPLPTSPAHEGVPSRMGPQSGPGWGARGPGRPCSVIIKAVLKRKGPRRILESDWIVPWRPGDLNFCATVGPFGNQVGRTQGTSRCSFFRLYFVPKANITSVMQEISSLKIKAPKFPRLVDWGHSTVCSSTRGDRKGSEDRRASAQG